MEARRTTTKGEKLERKTSGRTESDTNAKTKQPTMRREEEEEEKEQER